jgi:ribosomal protein L40E
MPDIVCPECSQVTSLVAVRRAAEEFCTQCDYPLFWAPSAIPMASPGSSNAATMRRLPGAAGRRQVGTRVCPSCGELNPLKGTHCVRCTAELDPKPVLPEPVPVVQVIEPEPEPEPEPIKRPWWIWLLTAALLAVEAAGIVLIAVLD